MQKYKQVALILAILTLVMTSGTTSAYADSREYSANGDGQIEKRLLILGAFEEKNYEAWKKIVGRGDISKIITKEKFDKFVEARVLARKGLYNESFDLSYDLGLDLQKEIDVIIKNERGVDFSSIVEKEDLVLIEEAKSLI